MRRFIYIICVMALVSCEKVIDIDYHDADSRYVVEGSLSATGTEVRVSKTNAMDDNSTGSDVDNAVVVITGDDGTTATIPFIRNGYYRSLLYINHAAHAKDERVQTCVEEDAHRALSVWRPATAGYSKREQLVLYAHLP